jgi:hypothetical protein
MAANPLVAQGQLNRVKASLTWLDHSELNVTAPFLGRDGISLSLEGNSTAFLPTLTGVVTSPEPYMMIGLTIHLVKPQALCALYVARLQANALLGNGTVRPDVIEGLPPFDVTNCAMESIREMRFNGTDDGFIVMCRGYITINNDMWQ